MVEGTPEVLARLRARDPIALRDVVQEHARRLYRAARGMGFSNVEAEDLAQDVFVTFLETLDRFEGRSSLGTWLYGMLRFKAQERRRAVVRDGQSDSIDEVFESRFDEHGAWAKPPIAGDRLVESRQADAALRDCLAALPNTHRDVFHLREVEGLSAAAVGEMLGCTANHVGVLFHRARARLRGCLEAKGWGRDR